jgi:hypothetical protein
VWSYRYEVPVGAGFQKPCWVVWTGQAPPVVYDLTDATQSSVEVTDVVSSAAGIFSKSQQSPRQVSLTTTPILVE